MAELQTESIPGVDILRVGEGFNGGGCPEGGCSFTAEDLDAIVQAYWATREARTPPLKLGHDADQQLVQQDGYPAAGWVANLRRLGDKLYADLLEVPKQLADLIRAGAYRFVSVELEKDMEVGGVTYPTALTGLALLGADLPAVDSLKGLAGLYQTLQLAELKTETTRAVMVERQDNADPPPSQHLAMWDTAFINDLPDSAFAYVAPGGQKDADGKTKPRSLRYLPHHMMEGMVDMPHLRNALARAPQTNLPAEAKAQAIRHLQSHARREGVGEG